MNGPGGESSAGAGPGSAQPGGPATTPATAPASGPILESLVTGRALLALFDAAEELVAVFDETGRLLRVNAAGRRLCSLAPGERVEGQPLSLIFAEPSARRLLEEALPAALRTGRWQGETRLRTSGLHNPVLLQTVVPLEREDGPQLFVTGARTDTAHRQEFEALRSSEARFRALMEHLGVGVVVQGRRSEILLCNQTALDLFGLTREEMMSRTSYDPAWEIVREDGSPFPAEERPVSVAAATLAPVRNVVMGIRRPRTQDLVWLLVDAVPELDPDGQLVNVVATLGDLTERKRLEETLLQAQKLESVGRLAGGIAHDFNNLLTIILGNAELALDEAPPGSLGHESLLLAVDAAQKAVGLTGQILSFARKQVIRPQRLLLAPFFARLHGLLRGLLGPAIELQVQLPEGLWAAQADPAQLERVLVNLAVNARDAMAPLGGGRLVIAASNRPSAAPAGRVGGREQVELTVSDTGAGMEPHVLRHLFEPFFTTKAEGHGTGLGLAIVHGIVSQSGGQIEVESTPGKGTTFRVRLPRAHTHEHEPASEARAGDAGMQAQPAATLLLVEDEPLVMRVAARMLAGAGYRVLEAVDGPSALALAARSPRPIDALVTDVRMLPMDGLVLARTLRAARPGLPVVFVSGFAEEASRAAGAGTWFVQKPFTRATLLAAVRASLAGARGG
jgi:PAS domain S-box-containing protein